MLTDSSRHAQDICSFNVSLCLFIGSPRAWEKLIFFNYLQKEQADGDFMNLVYIFMVNRQLELQTAVNTLVSMYDNRVKDYMRLKSEIPSFGSTIDSQLEIYFKKLECFFQGAIKWYYSSPSEFISIDPFTRMKRAYNSTLPAQDTSPLQGCPISKGI